MFPWYERMYIPELMAMLAMLVLLASCSQNRDASSAMPSGANSTTAEHVASGTASKPAIDRQAPAEFDTATFGLG